MGKRDHTRGIDGFEKDDGDECDPETLDGRHPAPDLAA
jgi:hypothetical protein